MATLPGEDEDVSPATHQPTNEQQKPEPTLLELHKMLVDIQINVNNILRENNELRSEIEELKSTVSRQTSEISILKSHLQNINNQFEEVEKRLYTAKIMELRKMFNKYALKKTSKYTPSGAFLRL